MVHELKTIYDILNVLLRESISNMKPISDDIEVKVTRYEDSHP